MPSAICPSVHAYISKCDIVGITVEPSQQLGKTGLSINVSVFLKY